MNNMNNTVIMNVCSASGVSWQLPPDGVDVLGQLDEASHRGESCACC